MGLNVRIRHLRGTTTADLPARPAERPVVIGRSAAADVRLPTFTPGDDHCAVFIKDRRWHVVDLFGAGQVLVNGVAADEPTPLRPGDVIAIGEGPDAPVVTVVGSAPSVPKPAAGAAVASASAPRPKAAAPAQRPAPPPQVPPPEPAVAYAAPAEADADATDFAGVAAPAAEPAVPYASPYRRPKKKSNPLPLLVGMLVAVLVAGGALFWLMRQQKPAAPAGPAVAAPGGPPAATPLSPDAGSPTPLAALRAYAAALEAGKPSGLKRAVAGDPERYAIAEQLMYFSFAVRQLEDAAVNRFGEAGRGTGRLGGPLPTEAAADPTLAEAVTGNTATVGRPGSSARLPFVRASGGWVVDLNAAFPVPADTVTATKLIADVTKRLASITEDLAAGKIASADEAKETVRGGVAYLQGLRPTGTAAAGKLVYIVGTPPPVPAAVAATRPASPKPAAAAAMPAPPVASATKSAPAFVPATMPAGPVSPANAKGGSPTPAEAVRAYAIAMESGDVDAVRRVTLGDDAHYAAMEPGILIGGLRVQLESAALKRFGAAGRGMGKVADTGDDTLTIYAAGGVPFDADVTGDTAMIYERWDKERLKTGIQVRRTPDGWKFDMRAMIPDPVSAQQSAAQRIAVFKVAVGMLRQGVADIDAGKYATAEEANAKLRRTLAPAMVTIYKSPERALAYQELTLDDIAFRSRPTREVTPRDHVGEKTVDGPPLWPGDGPPPPPEIVQDRIPDDKPFGVERLAFVADFAGPGLAPNLKLLGGEFLSSVDRLTPGQQSFRLVVPAPPGKPPLASSPAQATVSPAARAAAKTFVDGLKPAGAATDMAAAFDAAVADDPQLVMLLVGTDRTDGDALAKRVAAAVGRRAIRVDTILFVSKTKAAAPDFQQAALVAALKRIAEQYGGKFVEVREEDAGGP